MLPPVTTCNIDDGDLSVCMCASQFGAGSHVRSDESRWEWVAGASRVMAGIRNERGGYGKGGINSFFRSFIRRFVSSLVR